MSGWIQRSPGAHASAAAVLLLHVVAVAALSAIEATRPTAAPNAVVVRLVETPPPPGPQPHPPLSFDLAPPRLPPAVIALPRIAVADLQAPPAEAVPAAGVGSTAASPATGGTAASDPVPARSSAPEPPASAPAAPVFVQQLRYARFEPPEYPSLSRRLGESGLVMVRVVIDEQGVPREVSVYRSSGHERLDRAAVQAVRRARFHPYRENEQARPASALVPVRFELT